MKVEKAVEVCEVISPGVDSTNSAREINEWHAVFYCVDELLKSGASEAEATTLCTLDQLRDGAA